MNGEENPITSPTTAQSANSSLDCTNLTLSPDELVAEITNTECDNLGSSTGLSGKENNNCDDLTEMTCAIKQEVDAIAVLQALEIAANDASKCQDDTMPTHASFWSRVLRYCQAITCILCEYDPFVSTILKQGQFPQILMGSIQPGADGTGYPQWVTPDSEPTEGSPRPVMSSGIIGTVNEALLSSWHLWAEYPEFDYFAQTYDNADNLQNLMVQTTNFPPAEGNTALVSSNGSESNILYTYTDGTWVQTKVLDSDDKLMNFAVTHINSGYYADKGVYYFHDGTNHTWQVMDVDQTELEKKLAELQSSLGNAVTSADPDKQYALTTASSVEEAVKIECDSTRDTIVLITG